MGPEVIEVISTRSQSQALLVRFAEVAVVRRRHLSDNINIAVTSRVRRVGIGALEVDFRLHALWPDIAFHGGNNRGIRLPGSFRSTRIGPRLQLTLRDRHPRSSLSSSETHIGADVSPRENPTAWSTVSSSRIRRGGTNPPFDWA